jgi:hypothetical protein
VTYVPAALRRLVCERADGRCEYCLAPESMTLATHQVDHVVAQKHGGATEEHNLALSCALCNKYKGTDLVSIDAETHRTVSLFHPRRDRWGEHFRLDLTWITALSVTGRVTVRLLQLNHPDRITERKLLLAVGLLQIPY